MNAQVYDQYRKTSVETLTPAKLLLMLYDGALKNLRNAEKGLLVNDINVVHQELVKAQDIITELMATLNMEYDISKNLYDLYEYLYHRLVQANTGKDIEAVREVYQFVAEIRDTFARAAGLLGRGVNQIPAREFSIKG